MGSNWKNVALADISERIGDGLHGTPKYSDDGEYYFVNGNNLASGSIVYKEATKRVSFEEYKKHKKELGNSTVLVSINGTIGNVALYNGEEVVLGKSACYINLKAGISKEFVKYILSGYLFQEYIQRCSTGSTIKNVSLKMMRDFTFRIPESEKEQDKAVELLKLLDQKLNLYHQTNQTLEQMAQTLFKSWFVDFDPVFDNMLANIGFDLAKLPNDFPAGLLKRAEKRLLAITTLERGNEEILQHFPSEFDFNEQLGWIPLGWNASTTDDEFVVKGGSTPSTKNSDFWEGGNIHWTSPKDLSGNATKIMIDTSRKITAQGLTKITSGLLPIDTVLMSSRAPVGYLALAKIPIAINQGYIAITDAKTLSSEYTIQWLESVMDEIKSISGGTTFAEISKKTFKSIQIVIPKNEAINAYTKIAKANYQRITANVQEIKTLTETRDYLLPKLISGELQIPDAIIPAVMENNHV